MRFPRVDVQNLLSERFEQVEVLWDQDPYNPVNAFALTIKEFMSDHQIQQVDEGIQRFVEFKQEQTQCLAAVGLGHSDSRLPSSQDLSPLAA